MSKTQHSHETPVRPKAEVNFFDSELEARRKDEARIQEDSDKVVLEDEEYRGWIESPADEGMDTEDPLRKIVAPKVATPSRAEIEDHEKLHLPFRVWCKSCVKGRGVASPHLKAHVDDPKSPLITMDYCFRTSGVTILGVKDMLWGLLHQCGYR